MQDRQLPKNTSRCMMLREDDGEIKGFEVQMAQRRHRPPPYKGIISPSEVLSIGKIIQRI